MRCPHCHKRLLQHAADGRAKIRTPVVVISVDGQMAIACRHCGQDVPLDATAGPRLTAAVAEKGPPLVVRHQ